MAIIDKNGGIHGSAGSVVYRTYRGMNVVQSKPKKKKQTPASIRSACEFGLASSAARVIREAFYPLHRSRHDGGMGNRLTSAVCTSIRASAKERGERDLHDGNLSFLEGFSFNAASPLFPSLQVKPQVSLTEEGQVKVELPEINLDRELLDRFYEAKRFRIRFLLIAFNFREEFYELVDMKEAVMDRGEQIPAQELLFDNDRPKGSLLLLSASIDYLSYNRLDKSYEPLNTKEFSPCDIIAAFPAVDEAEPGYRKQRYQELPEATRNSRTGLFGGYKGAAMREKVDKLNGQGRQWDSWRAEDSGIGGRKWPKEDDWKDMIGKRTSFKE
ncbi:hypothetical protein [Arcticibacter sp. MXS-1]|uniref:hypothetical protein n=1 Tax=Arcticibacter sp. MXS-1 TaxID=3341726 RepID=UPI0035A8B4C6